MNTLDDTAICSGHGPMRRTEIGGVVVHVACSTCGKQPIDLLETMTYHWGGTFRTVHEHSDQVVLGDVTDLGGSMLLMSRGMSQFSLTVRAAGHQINKAALWADGLQFPTAWQLWREKAPVCPTCMHRSRMRIHFATDTWSCKWGHVVTAEELCGAAR